MLLQEGMHKAFVEDGFGIDVTSHHTSDKLKEVRLAAKDIFDVAGATCGAGNPDWKSAQSVAKETAAAVQWLIDAGASWIGKTVTDELTYSLSGMNVHYGTPVNPKAPERVPGGSSSGSVVAVATGDADIALGSDCAGSVRLPSSYCGVWGMRPSHGRVCGKGCFTLAHSFDTIGVFAREGDLLARAMGVLLGSEPVSPVTAKKILLSEDLCAQLDDDVKKAFLQMLSDAQIDYEVIPAGTFDLTVWANAFRILQGGEIWQQHGHWIRSTHPTFAPDVAARFEQASKITSEEILQAQQVRSHVHAKISALLTDAVMITPPVPGPAMALNASPEEVNATRAKSFNMLCIAGLVGLPQVVMPWTTVNGAPVGLSLIGNRHTDEVTLAVARALFKQVQEVKAS